MTDMREEFEKWLRTTGHIVLNRTDAWIGWEGAWNHRSVFPKSDADWVKHRQTIEAKRQWDEVAQALGVDGDDVDAVLAAAKAKSKVPEHARELLAAIRGKCSKEEWQAICDVFIEQDKLIDRLQSELELTSKSDGIVVTDSMVLDALHAHSGATRFSAWEKERMRADLAAALQADAGREGK